MSALPPLPAIRLGHYRHYKGGEYEVIGLARHSESLEPLVIYKHLEDGSLWARSASMWEEMVEIDGVQKPRFAFQA